MKQSTPSAPRLKSPPSFLFRGPPGGGKTSFGMQFPGVWFGDVDLNLNGPESFLRSRDKGLEFFYDTITLDDHGDRIINKTGAYDWAGIWLRCKTKALEAIRDPVVKIIYIDGLTQLNNILVNKIMVDNKTSTMEIQHWVPFRNELMTLVMRCRHAGKPFIMSCHEEATMDRQQVITGYKIAVSTRLKDVFGGLFTDIYAFQNSVGAGGKKTFKLRCAPDGFRKDLKTSFPSMPVEIDVTENGFATVNKYMNLPIG